MEDDRIVSGITYTYQLKPRQPEMFIPASEGIKLATKTDVEELKAQIAALTKTVNEIKSFLEGDLS